MKPEYSAMLKEYQDLCVSYKHPPSYGGEMISNARSVSSSEYSNVDFSIISIGPLSLKLSGQVKGGEDWVARLSIKVTLLGKEVFSNDALNLNPEHSYIHLNPGLLFNAANADIYIGVKDQELYVKAKACAIAVGCTDWYEKTLFKF